MNVELTSSDTKAAHLAPSLSTEKADAITGEHNAWRLPIGFEATPPPKIFRKRVGRNSASSEAFEFQRLLVDILARFVNLPAPKVDLEIENALYRVCEFLGVERAGLWRECNGSFLLTHHCLYPRCPSLGSLGGFAGTVSDPISVRTARLLTIGADSRDWGSWLTTQAIRGKRVAFSSIRKLPEEAAEDKKTLIRLNTVSGVIIPFLVGGKVLGALTLEMISKEKDWSQSLLKRLEFVAQVFAQAVARKISDEKLLASETQLTMAAASADAALWSLDLRTRRFQTTAKAYELLRLKPGLELTLEGFLQLVHPEDRERVRQGTEETIRSRGEIDIEFRVVLSGGDTYWVSSRGRCHYSPNGAPKQLMGVAANITQRKHAESRLRESETRFRTVADSAPVLIWLCGPDKLCSFFNKPWLDFTGRTAEQEQGNGWVEGVHVEDREQCLQTFMSAFEARETFVMQYRLRRRDGEYRWILDNGVPRYDAQGEFSGYIGSCVDITERKIAEEALAKSYAEIKELKDRLQAESDYLKAEIKVTQAEGEIIGRSEPIRRVLHQVEQVAPTECSVLITGETGTGKELIAQLIHRLSARKQRVMVLVNCAALPSALVESELFGRERGAYTGALTSQIGRFEVANGSTIFLDEVGELSMEVQAKLLRVLQQGEFQRLGSPKTHKVDVRVIAATNRDLGEEVRKGRFREDLYYRLKVFPIEIPPLRERMEDLPLLVFAHMEEFGAKMGKKVTKIPRKAMEMLQAHTWPGNIRELRNVIEHSVILSSGDTLKLGALGEAPIREAAPVTLADAEREHILKTLESTRWRIKGPHGAASRLGLQPSTLYSRMQKLGIPHRRQKDEMTTNGLYSRPH